MIYATNLTKTASDRYVGEASEFEETRRGFPSQVEVVNFNGDTMLAKREMISRNDGEIEYVDYALKPSSERKVTIRLFND
jgi:hypothetical protein